MQFSTVGRVSLSLGNRFYKILLVSALCNSNERLRKISAGKLDDTFFSKQHAQSLLSWYKRNKKEYTCKEVPNLQRYDSVNNDAIIYALSRLVISSDEMAPISEYGKIKRERISSLSAFVKYLLNPRVTHDMDIDAVCNLFELSCKRAVWAIAFGIANKEPNNRIVLPFLHHSITAPIFNFRHAESINGKTLTEIEANPFDAYAAYNEILSRICIDSPVEPVNAHTAFDCVFNYVKSHYNYCSEIEALSPAELSLMNAYLSINSTDNDTNESVWKQYSNSSAIMKITLSKDSDWILSPILDALHCINYTVYMPMHIEPEIVMNCQHYGTSIVHNIPCNPRYAKLILGKYGTDTPSAVAVVCVAATPKEAHKKAKIAVSSMLDAICIAYPMLPVRYFYNPHTYFVISDDGSMQYSSTLPMIYHNILMDMKDVKRNIDIYSRLSCSEYLMHRQLSRCASLLRLAAECGHPETSFLHAWRALEAVCGHLTGRKAPNDIQFRTIRKWLTMVIGNKKKEFSFDPKNYLSVLLTGARDKLIDEEGLPNKREISRSRNDINNILSIVEDIRNKWVFHTGDERLVSSCKCNHQFFRHSEQYLVRSPEVQLLSWPVVEAVCS